MLLSKLVIIILFAKKQEGTFNMQTLKIWAYSFLEKEFKGKVFFNLLFPPQLTKQKYYFKN